jgi:hypothetical protein
MLETIVATAFLAALVVVPLAWRVWRDRAEERALALQADLRAAIFRALHGESLLAVRVLPPMPWRPGRVFLSAPAGWQWLVEAAWGELATRVPEGYEVVITPAPRALPSPAPRALRRAA